MARTDEYYLRGLRRVLAREGKITEKLMKGHGIFSGETYTKHFGSLLRAYELVGYKPTPHAFKSVEHQQRKRKLRADLLNRLRQIYPENMRVVHLPGQTVREIVEFDRHVRVTIHVCRQGKSVVSGDPRWLLRSQPLEAGYPCLVCLPDKQLTTLGSLYMMPHFSDIVKQFKTLKEGDKWLAGGRKLKDLSELRAAATVMAAEWQEHDDTTIVGDVVISSRSSTITIAGKDITLPPINAEHFKTLVLNAGKVVSRAQLFHPFRGSEFPSSHLNVHMCLLRVKLGPKFRERIQTVANKGYMYVMPTAEQKFGNVALQGYHGDNDRLASLEEWRRHNVGRAGLLTG